MNLLKMIKKFYKEEDNKWYIDLPEWIEKGLPKEDLEMVCGADALLEILSKNTHEVHVDFNVEPFEGYTHELDKIAEDELGASYIVLNPRMYPLEIWLCPVTTYVFGNYPDKIYLK